MIENQDVPKEKDISRVIFEGLGKGRRKICMRCGVPIFNRMPHAKYCKDCAQKTYPYGTPHPIKQQSRKQEIMNKIVDFHKDYELHGVVEIAIALEESVSTVGTYIRLLEAEGKIRMYNSYYFLPKPEK